MLIEGVTVQMRQIQGSLNICNVCRTVILPNNPPINAIKIVLVSHHDFWPAGVYTVITYANTSTYSTFFSILILLACYFQSACVMTER